MKHRLTEGVVKRLPVPEKGNRIFYDSLVSGFGLRVTAGGDRSFVLNYRTRSTGRERRYTIGKIEQWGATGAREEARKLKRAIDAGHDPLEALETERGAPTVADLAARYEADHLPRKRERSQEEDRPLLKIIVGEFDHRKVAEITYGQVDALHQKVTRERGPYRANRVLALLSKMLSLAVRWEWRPDNPCKSVERNQEQKRNRYLSPDEIARLMTALDGEEDRQAADIIRLLLLTGARSGEVLRASWDQFDLERGIWTKPHTLTKQKEEHRLPLSAEALDLLKRLRGEVKGKARYVFPASPDGPFKPREDIRHAWDRVRGAADLNDVRIHDLRHTHASLLVNAGYSLPVIGAVLGHKTPSTTARYAHIADDSVRAAVQSVGKIIPLKGRA